MGENRSFDHLLGWLHEEQPDIDGLTGDEWNALSTTDPNSQKLYVNKHGYDESPSDPNHDIDSTTEQIFGYLKPYNQTGIPKMNGFVQNAYENNLNYTTTMSMFTKDTSSAPIINHLALEYAVFDKWYASLPGPTDPNRAFAMSGTSNGMVENFNGTLWSQQSYFDFLTQHQISWQGYYQIDPWALFYFEDTNQPQNRVHMHHLDKFFRDLDNGNLAQFSWLQPQMNTHQNPPDWQHPDASVKEGERLIKTVYEALRNSSYWENTALLITYDEHGGFYDHVTPPQVGVPAPDGVVASDGFTFDRLGIRIPTIVISPWIPKGTIVHRAQGPTPTSEYDHTSVIATCNKLFGITDTMTARSTWAGTFEGVFSLSSPRVDCPKKLADIPAWTMEDLKKQWAKPLNDHLEIQIQFYCKFNQRDENCGKDIHNQLDASLFIEHEVAVFLSNLHQRT